MDPNTERVAAGLEKAMQAEIEGQHFYQMAAQNTPDARGREVFETLAREELEHYEFLKAQYQSLKQTGRVDAEAKLGEPLKLEGPHPIFSSEIRRRIGGAHYEMTALSIGIQLELSAVNFYRAEAEATSDPQVAAFHQRLAAWEKGHLSALQAQSEALKEDYWHESGFAPF
jgi:rubrerythrin